MTLPLGRGAFEAGDAGSGLGGGPSGPVLLRAGGRILRQGARTGGTRRHGAHSASACGEPGCRCRRCVTGACARARCVVGGVLPLCTPWRELRDAPSTAPEPPGVAQLTHTPRACRPLRLPVHSRGRLWGPPLSLCGRGFGLCVFPQQMCVEGMNTYVACAADGVLLRQRPCQTPRFYRCPRSSVNGAPDARLAPGFPCTHMHTEGRAGLSGRGLGPQGPTRF